MPYDQVSNPLSHRISPFNFTSINCSTDPKTNQWNFWKKNIENWLFWKSQFSPKTNEIFSRISALASNKRSNQKSKYNSSPFEPLLYSTQLLILSYKPIQESFRVLFKWGAGWKDLDRPKQRDENQKKLVGKCISTRSSNYF